MRRIDLTTQYRKDLKTARKRNLQESDLNAIIFKLANDEPLPQKNKDHALSGDFAGTRECHIHPDWLLVYSKSEDNSIKILTLIRTGSHSDIFGK